MARDREKQRRHNSAWYKKNKDAISKKHKERYNKKNKKIREEKLEHEKTKHPLLQSNGNKPKRGIVLSCKLCNKEFYVPPCRIGIAKGYCSNKCIYKHAREKGNRICVICGGNFYCVDSQIRLRGRKTCSRKCRAEYITMQAEKRIQTAPKSDKRKNDRCIRYSKKSDVWKKGVFERDNYTCKICGDRSRKGHGVVLHAHHIKSFSEYPKLRTDINNGITLCKDCHVNLHRELKRLKKIFYAAQEHG